MSYVRHLIILTLGVTLTACGGSGGGSGAVGAPGTSPSGPQSKVITVRSGSGFDCLLEGTSLYCRGAASNNDLLTLTGGGSDFVPVASGSLVSFTVYDDTVCLEATVAQRPLSRTAGQATYCFGEATLNASYTGFPVVYGGPQYDHAANGSTDLSYNASPFVGGDLTLSQLTDPGMMTPVISDGTGSVTSETLTCSSDGTTLTCPDFVVTL